MNTHKKTNLIIDNDIWEVSYTFVSSLRMIRVEINLLRPNKKWYQRRYSYTDYIYTPNIEKAELSAKSLIDKFYLHNETMQKIIDFFES